MNFIDLGRGVRASRVVLGTDSLRSGSLVSKRRHFSLLDEAFDHGINTFETARIYQSEPVLAQWASTRSRRSKIVLVTKGGFPDLPTAANIRRDCHYSLRALRTEFIDCYLIHYDCLSADLGEMLDTLDELRTRGKIRSFGLSNFSFQRARQAHRYCIKNGIGPARVLSAHYGLISWNTPFWKNAQTLVGPGNKSARSWYEENGYLILAYSPLGRGYFKSKAASANEPVRDDSPANDARYRRACHLADARGVSAAQIALAYILNRASNTLAVIGCRNVEHLRKNGAAANILLSKAECSWLDLESAPTERLHAKC